MRRSARTTDGSVYRQESTTPSGRLRLPAVTSLDARVEKRFKFGSSYLALDFDVFNLLNSGTVLGRQYDEQLTGPTGFGNVLEIMNPRIARLGVRFTF